MKKKVLAVFVFVLGLSMVLASWLPAQATTEGKVYVCKYVGTPGVDERLQTGQNPIEVNVNSIGDWPVAIGSYFTDAHGRSFILGFVPMVPEPTTADCPQPPYVPCSETVPGTAPATEYGEWGACVEGVQTRTVKTYTAPLLDSVNQSLVCVPPDDDETVEQRDCTVTVDPVPSWVVGGSCANAHVVLKLDGVIVGDKTYSWNGEESYSYTFPGYEAYGSSPLVDNPNLNPDTCTVIEPTPTPKPQVTGVGGGSFPVAGVGYGLMGLATILFAIPNKKKII